MSDKDTGGKAYPAHGQGGGMTLLDHNALELAKARIIGQGMPKAKDTDEWAERSYQLADAMIKAKRARE